MSKRKKKKNRRIQKTISPESLILLTTAILQLVTAILNLIVIIKTG